MELRPILSTLRRHKTAASLIVLLFGYFVFDRLRDTLAEEV